MTPLKKRARLAVFWTLMTRNWQFWRKKRNLRQWQKIQVLHTQKIKMSKVLKFKLRHAKWKIWVLVFCIVEMLFKRDTVFMTKFSAARIISRASRLSMITIKISYLKIFAILGKKLMNKVFEKTKVIFQIKIYL